MSFEYAMRMAEILETNGQNAARNGNSSAAARFFRLASERLREAASYNPDNTSQLLRKAKQLEEQSRTLKDNPGACGSVGAAGGAPTGASTGAGASQGYTPPQSAGQSKTEKQKETAPAREGGRNDATIDNDLLQDALNRLNAMVGLDDLKKQMMDWVKQIQVFQLRKARGIKVPDVSYHMVFMGNPGTGKTTVARLLVQIYCALGIAENTECVEVARTDLVAGYVGQTATKTHEVIERAMGGMLFIDEAYTLANGDDFGQEAINTLLKEMEDHRDRLVVVVAGYDDLMHKFIDSNPGLKSRFTTYLHFSDYNGEQLMRIFKGLCEKNQFVLAPDAEEMLTKYFDELYEHRDRNFGNGRDVRNVFEEIVKRQSVRIYGCMNSTNEIDLTEIRKEDLPFYGE